MAKKVYLSQRQINSLLKVQKMLTSFLDEHQYEDEFGVMVYNDNVQVLCDVDSVIGGIESIVENNY